MIKNFLGKIFPQLISAPSLRQELTDLLEESSDHQAGFDSHEGTLLRNFLGLRDLTAADVMIPRADILSVGMAESFS